MYRQKYKKNLRVWYSFDITLNQIWHEVNLFGGEVFKKTRSGEPVELIVYSVKWRILEFFFYVYIICERVSFFFFDKYMFMPTAFIFFFSFIYSHVIMTFFEGLFSAFLLFLLLADYRLQTNVSRRNTRCYAKTMKR